MPTMRSLCSFATASATRELSSRRSDASPKLTSQCSAKMPGKAMFRNGRIRTSAASITCLRKPWILPGPADPASINVVQPEKRAYSSGSTPSEVPPQ